MPIESPALLPASVDECGYEPLAEVWRSGVLESAHSGVALAVDAKGAVVWAHGRPDLGMFPRSALKPLQAAAMLAAGLDLDAELLALAASSHSGQTFHTDGVGRILASAGLTDAALQCPIDWPLDEATRIELAAGGGGPTRLAMNCSGKHAAMLATCVVNDWDVETYLEADHPLQRALRTTIETFVGEQACVVAVDGCGAPLFGFSLAALAHGFGALASAPAGTPLHQVAEAMRAHPRWVGGTGRDVTALMSAVPGLVAKDGAEGVFAAALMDGSAGAVKIGDGGSRAAPVVLAGLLVRLGVPPAQLVDFDTAPVLGHGQPVGAVRRSD
jgi:L-asparaginase II